MAKNVFSAKPMTPPVSSVNGPILKMKPISKPFEALTYQSGLFTDKKPYVYRFNLWVS